MRAEFHRLAVGVTTSTRREVGSSVFQVFEGAGTVTIDDETHAVEKGDLVVVPSWSALTLATEDGLDLFRFGDQPIVERLGFARVHEVVPNASGTGR
jgi:gentisate 1,2-dioxygenase